MGQSLNKQSSGSGGGGGEIIKGNEIVSIIKKCYDEQLLADFGKEDVAEFYHAVSHTIQEINKNIGTTQIRVPDIASLQQIYEKHHQGNGDRAVTNEEFENILKDVILKSGISGIRAGAKDFLMFIFGVPATTLFIKQRIAPTAIPNSIFIPLVTSATVFVLAKLNKI
ncbi:uncharacterized protein LOC124914009 [Impatiens glandulifera]|uniref:uncharacterized protein LOC124914009 n=1 Tax=Impatiens glandulifera TaxID=253017 RepID=UPI001FB09311|nr:uncharacterized protein LOC124914009 [Impatiens glandulifera]